MIHAPESSGEPTDQQLIERWKSGDSRAATQLVARHADALARFAASSGEREEIEQLVQDTFVRAFGSLDSFRGESSLRTWLLTIERRLMLDRRRADMRQKTMVPIEDVDAATGYDALDEMIADEAETMVRRAVEALSPMQREVFTMRVDQGLSYNEIAAVVGSTEGAARVHYHNAMRAVKEFLCD